MPTPREWDYRFLSLARHIPGWSKAPSTKCGAAIVDVSRRIVSLGYNGFPKGVPDDPALLEDRSQKYARVVHAEMNAILFAQRPLGGCTLYTWPFMSCSQCTPVVIQTGILRCVAPKLREDHPLHERWATTTAREHFQQAGIELILLDMD